MPTPANRIARQLHQAVKLRTGGRAGLWVRLRDMAPTLGCGPEQFALAVDYACARRWITTAGLPPHSASLTADGLTPGPAACGRVSG